MGAGVVGGCPDPSAGLMVGTASLRPRLTPTMRRNESKVRRLKDREQLLKVLRDHDVGKMNHLLATERRDLVESVKRRIADLNETIVRLDSET